MYYIFLVLLEHSKQLFCGHKVISIEKTYLATKRAKYIMTTKPSGHSKALVPIPTGNQVGT